MNPRQYSRRAGPHCGFGGGSAQTAEAILRAQRIRVVGTGSARWGNRAHRGSSPLRQGPFIRRTSNAEPTTSGSTPPPGLFHRELSILRLPKRPSHDNPRSNRSTLV